jgi:hypothetical protein
MQKTLTPTLLKRLLNAQVNGFYRPELNAKRNPHLALFLSKVQMIQNI